MRLKVSFLVVALLVGIVAPATAQNKKPRKKLKELLLIADSLRLQLRQSADRGRMLQWGDSILMVELGKSKMSERKKQRFMKHYAKIQRRLKMYNRHLFIGDLLLAANYNKVKYDTNYIARPDARWTIKLRGNLSGADLQTIAKTYGLESKTKVMADCRGTLSMAVAYRGMGLGLAVNPAKLAGKNRDYEFNLNSYSNRYGFDVVYLSSKTFHGHQQVGGNEIDAFNYRKFSFPAAFSQSYIQKRSAGSFMVGASFDGQKTKVKGMAIRLNGLAVGAGYAYNLVPSSHLLFHLSALPTITVYSHDYTKMKAETVDGVRMFFGFYIH